MTTPSSATTPAIVQESKKIRDGPGPNSLQKHLHNQASLESMGAVGSAAKDAAPDPSTSETQPMETQTQPDPVDTTVRRCLDLQFGDEAA